MADRITPGSCLVCGARLEVRKLYCPACDITIEGRFNMCKFCYLNQEQREFVETFIRCRGNIKEVERELGVSYPTVRNRLDAVIMALGYTVEAEETDARVDEGRRKVLESLNKGEISAEDAIKILRRK
ncbi:MAG: DUF2089 domain-containing protein [Bacillota bacterium]|nr:DUF2089 domain-containing protein [Bacillota bacterium]